MIDLSLIIPTIRPDNHLPLLNSIKESIGSKSYEVIFVGPDWPDGKVFDFSVKFVHSHKSPIACCQAGSHHAEGRLLCQGADDAIYIKNGLSDCIDLYDKTCSKKDFIAIRYSENNIQRHPNYFFTFFHDDLKEIESISNLAFSPICLVDAGYFRELGGWNCIDFECANMPTLDFCFRLLLNGGQLHFSPNIVLDCIWEQGESGTHGPVHRGEIENDIPKFKEIWGQNKYKIFIDYNNHEKTPAIWKRRFP